MKKRSLAIVLPGIIGALFLFISCGGGGGGGDGGGSSIGGGSGGSAVGVSPIETAPELSGYAVKGPFAKGAKVEVYRLSKSGEPEGHLFFESSVLNDEGEYHLVFPLGFQGLVLVVVKGQYRDEALGELKEGELKLVESIDADRKKERPIDVLSTVVAEALLNAPQENRQVTPEKVSEKTQMVSEQLGIGNNPDRLVLLQTALSQILSSQKDSQKSSKEALTDFIQKIVSDVQDGAWEGETKNDISNRIYHRFKTSKFFRTSFEYCACTRRKAFNSRRS